MRYLVRDPGRISDSAFMQVNYSVAENSSFHIFQHHLSALDYNQESEMKFNLSILNSPQYGLKVCKMEHDQQK